MTDCRIRHAIRTGRPSRRPVRSWLVFAGIIMALPASAQDGSEAMRGIVRARDEALISTDLNVRIETLGFREGESFAKGDVLATFDCSDLRAQVKSAEALLRAEQITSANNARLAKSKAVGNFEVELSQAKADQAAAEVETFRSKISRCTITAPFDGRVSLMRAHAHEIPEPNQPMMQIVGHSELEIEALLPSRWLRWLKPGAPFSVSIDETGKTLPAEVTRIGAVVDPVSQTVKVTGRFTGDSAGILPGMSGPTRFPSQDD